MLKQELAKLLEETVLKAQREGALPAVPLPEVVLEHPQDPGHGDFATGLPLKLARAMRMSPVAIAEEICRHLALPAEIDRVAVAPPGFINLTLSDGWLSGHVQSVLDAGGSYGDIDLGRGKRVQIEFVSANPTGPLHVGGGRGAVLGSTLANVLAASGFSVEREYYVNDTGSQIENFGRTLYVRYLQCLGKEAALPEDGYRGHYMVDLAGEIVQEEGEKFLLLSEAEAVSELAEIGTARMVERIKQDFALVNVAFDVWFSEKSLYEGGQYDKAMDMLKRGGYVTERENAIWLTSSLLGEDKDDVLVRSNGAPTYLASDIAYHYDKFLVRRFDRVVDIWGADHQGHVGGMRAMLKALGLDPERLRIIIHQLVTLRWGEEIVKVSKRSGDIITLRELVDEVGPDPCRFFFLSRSADSQMDFDVELAKRQSADNPVYYVQYAHARIASIIRLAEERGIDYAEGDVSLLCTEPELTLIRRLVLLPEIVERVAVSLEPHHLPYYAQDLATVFHSFYKQCRVVSEDRAMTAARLKLVKATQIVLARVLGLMGMTAPDRM
ncbi:MAG: arginine--tRNA ligase [Dehalococcoidia bacterium]